MRLPSPEDPAPATGCGVFLSAAYDRPASASIFSVDTNIVIGQIGGPDLRRKVPAPQLDTHCDIGAAHDCRTRRLGIIRRPLAIGNNTDFIEEDTDARDVEIIDPCASYSGQYSIER